MNDFLKGKGLVALNPKDDEISFLRGHVAQLTQSISQLSLKPGGVRPGELLFMVA
jgi:hypothetical protein